MDIPPTMKAMVLDGPKQLLWLRDVPVPRPGPGQVLLHVRACGVCRTDLHIVDGELPGAKFPLILGHQIVGTVVAAGSGSKRFQPGDRVGVPWLGWTDQSCPYCRRGQENLCDHPLFTGFNVDGGYAEYAVAWEDYAFPLPGSYEDPDVAPLLCAGLIGYRTYRLAGEHKDRLGIFGFGSAAHIVAQVAIHQGKKVYAFTRPGDTRSQEFARGLGAAWAGGSDEVPPEPLDAAMVFAPVGPLMVKALEVLGKGGTVVSGGIHMSDIPAFPYSRLWEERSLRSVANLTRADGEEFLKIAPEVPVKVRTNLFALEDVNRALEAIRSGELEGSAVLTMPGFRKKP
jgi:propanol-preferring alcohol dehydrogenase